MNSDDSRLSYLLHLRDSVLEEMEAADLAFSRLRMRVERMESDLRIGRSEPAEYSQTKGHALPQAEEKLLAAFRELMKLEDKINAAREIESQAGRSAP
jgi:hypothetical protein